MIASKKLYIFIAVIMVLFPKVISAQWIQTSLSYSNINVRVISLSGKNIFAGTDYGVFLSTDNGTTWNMANAGITTSRIYSLAVDSENIFAGTDHGVFHSTNNGASWMSVNKGLIDSVVLVLIFNGTKLFAGTNSGIFVSTNNGASWSVENSGLTNQYVRSLAFNATAVFVGTCGGIFRLGNNDTSWVQIDSGVSITNNIVWSLTTNDKYVYAGTVFDGPNSGAMISTDNGNSWSAINNGFSSNITGIFALAACGNYLFAGTAYGGVYFSTNNGKNWTACNTGLTTNVIYSFAISDSTIFAGAYNGLFISTIKKLPVNQIQPALLAPSNGSTGITISPKLVWQKDLGVSSYNLQLSTDDNFITTIINKTGIKDTVFYVTGLSCDSTYFWRVSSTDSVGTGPWSSVFCFTTIFTAAIDTLNLGPSTTNISIPDNSIGYVYFKMTSNGNPISYNQIFSIILLDQTNKMDSVNAIFLQPGILRIEIPGNILTNNSKYTFTLPDSIKIGTNNCIIQNKPLPIFVTKVPQSYNRTFDFFAEGSAGVSGSVGSIGLGASIAMAKISVSGTNGMGLTITVDPDSNLTLSRRFESGISADLEIPSINTVVGKVSAGISAGLTEKTIESQDISLAELQNITPDQVKMTQAGFVLETLSNGVVNVSSTFGILLNAIKQTLFNSSGITQTLNDALIKTSWGLDIEGNFNSGFNAAWGNVNIGLANASITGVLSGRTNYYPGGLANIGNSITSKSISVASDFDFSLLNFSFANNDGVSLGSSNLGLFDIGAGMKTEVESFYNSNNQLQQVDLSLEGGGNINIFGTIPGIYYNTEIDIPGEYQNVLEKNNFALNGLLLNNSNIPLENITQNIPAIIDTVSNNFIQTPLSITTFENVGSGTKTFLGIDLDGGLGVSLGLSLGLDLTYYDEISFPKKFSLLYANNNNYLIYSSNYSYQMSSYVLSAYLKSLIEGTSGIVKTSFLNLMSSVKQAVSSGENFVLNGINNTGNFIGSIKGKIFQGGQWFVTTFDANFPHFQYSRFHVPIIKNYYSSTKILNKRLLKTTTLLDTVNTIMIAVSDNMKISFIPDGQTTSVNSVDTAFTISMVIDTAKLSANGFTLADTSRIKIFRSDDSTGNWILEGGTLSGDTVKTNVKYMSNYLLGIEVTNADDKIPPGILEYGPKQDSTFTSYPMIFAKIQDNQYGVGVNWAKTCLIANGDTLNASYDPTNQMIFYNLSGKDSLKGTINVTIWTTDYNGNNDSIKFSFNLNITGIKDAAGIVNSFKLFQNYPNPFNPTTIISYSVAKKSDVKIIIFNAIGQYIATLVKEKQSAGNYTINFSGRRLASGIYFYSYTAIPDDGSAEYRESRKMVLLK